MILKVYSVYDRKANVYGVPFFQLNNSVALRSFTDLVNDGRSTVCKHPEDYTLECIGEFDDSDGTLVSGKATEKVCNGLSVKKPEEPNQVMMPFKKGDEKIVADKVPS